MEINNLTGGDIKNIFIYFYKSRSRIPHIYLLSGRIQEKNQLSKNVKKRVRIPIMSRSGNRKIDITLNYFKYKI